MTKVVHEQLKQEMETQCSRMADHNILIIINSDKVLCMKAFVEWENFCTMCGRSVPQLDDPQPVVSPCLYRFVTVMCLDS